MLSLLLLLFATIAASPPPLKKEESSSSSSSDTDCEGCVEHLEKSNAGPHVYGACCFGDRSLGEDFTKERCTHVWAGPNTNANDCSGLKPCCYATENGKCTHEHCFSCVTNGGKLVDYCADCKAEPKPTTTTKLEHTKPTKTHHTKPTEPETKHDKPKLGCCCTRDKPPHKTTAEECHECGGTYRGDGSSCNEDDPCEARCCDPKNRQCGKCKCFEDWNTPKFVGFGADACCDGSCGVTCCINAKAVDAKSSDQCRRQGGTPFEGVSVEDAKCGGGCCNGVEFSIVSCKEECNGRYLGDGVGFSPGVCGGCGCLANGVGAIYTEKQCANTNGCVFQGNDTVCNQLEAKRNPPPPPKHEDSESSSSSSSSDSWFSEDSENSQPEAPVVFDLCQNDGCCCYKDDKGHATKKMVRDSVACFNLGGVFQGEGVKCDSCSCKGGVCCDGRGGFPVNKKAECDLKQGRYAGDGTSLDMPGVCDHLGGACYCNPHAHQAEPSDSSSSSSSSDSEETKKRVKAKRSPGIAAPHEDDDGDDEGQCLETPNATVCEQFGCGNTFRGVGTRCPKKVEQIPGDDNEGACCVPRQFDQDHHLCEIVPNEKACLFVGGSWKKKGSKCGDDTCKALIGRCCKKGEHGQPPECNDGYTADECKECGGHWGGPDSLCSDEFACDPKHVGACCRAGCSCSVTTPKVCQNTGGNFKGFDTKCQDLNNGICKLCAPCTVNSESCSDAKPCSNPAATCDRRHGKCMILATPIKSEYDNEIADPYVDSSSSSSSSSDDETKKSYIGPLSCGDKSTIGMPCLAKPLLGKCRIGVCSAPPAHSSLSETCESVCRDIKEYECDCECDSSWLKTCGTVAGRLINDKNKNGKFEANGDSLIGGVRVDLVLLGANHDKTSISHQTTSNNGHYAFTGLAPGLYSVEVKLPGCFVAKKPTPTKLECLEQSANSLRASTHGVDLGHVAHVSSYSANLQIQGKAAHLADSIDIFAHEDCDKASDESDNDGEWVTGHDSHNGDDDDEDGSGSISGWVIGLIVVAAVILCAVIVVCCCLRAKKMQRRSDR